MNLRDANHISPPARVLAKRSAFRIEISSASLLIGVLLGGLVSALYFTFHYTFRGESVALEEVFVFGRHSRVGSIVTVPISGDYCRQAAFNNDNGVIVPLGEISCVLVITRVEDNPKDARDPDKFAVISEKFRK
jgi:hypothetical protein